MDNKGADEKKDQKSAHQLKSEIKRSISNASNINQVKYIKIMEDDSSESGQSASLSRSSSVVSNTSFQKTKHVKKHKEEYHNTETSQRSVLNSSSPKIDSKMRTNTKEGFKKESDEYIKPSSEGNQRFMENYENINQHDPMEEESSQRRNSLINIKRSLSSLSGTHVVAYKKGMEADISESGQSAPVSRSSSHASNPSIQKKKDLKKLDVKSDKTGNIQSSSVTFDSTMKNITEARFESDCDEPPKLSFEDNQTSILNNENKNQSKQSLKESKNLRKVNIQQEREETIELQSQTNLSPKRNSSRQSHKAKQTEFTRSQRSSRCCCFI